MYKKKRPHYRDEEHNWENNKSTLPDEMYLAETTKKVSTKSKHASEAALDLKYQFYE